MSVGIVISGVNHHWKPARVQVREDPAQAVVPRVELLDHRVELEPGNAVLVDSLFDDGEGFFIEDVHTAECEHLGELLGQLAAPGVQAGGLFRAYREQQVGPAHRTCVAQVMRRLHCGDIRRNLEVEHRSMNPAH